MIPPESWSAKTKPIPNDFILNNVMKQKGSAIGKGVVDVNSKKSVNMRFDDFAKNAEELKTKLLGEGRVTIPEIENITWRTMCTTAKSYATENEGTLFNDDVGLWNLDRFTNQQSNIHSKNTHHTSVVSPIRPCFAMPFSPLFLYYVG